MATKKKAPTAPVAVENNSQTTENEAAVMKEQVAYQLAQLLKMAEKMGVNLEEVFPRPPKETTVVAENPSTQEIVNIAAQAAVAAMRGSAPTQGPTAPY